MAKKTAAQKRAEELAAYQDSFIYRNPAPTPTPTAASTPTPVAAPAPAPSQIPGATVFTSSGVPLNPNLPDGGVYDPAAGLTYVGPGMVVAPGVTPPTTVAITSGAVTSGASTTGPNTTGANTNNISGGVTQEQLNAALEAQAAKFAAENKAALAAQAEALARQQKEAATLLASEREAEKRATKQKASDKLVALFSSYDLGNLAEFINKRIMDDVSEDMLMIELYERPEYQQRFPGMAALRKAGKSISEKEYMGIEKQMEQTARFFDLPTGFYDGPEDFGNLIGKSVSAKEFQDRLQVGQDLSRSLNPYVKEALTSLYGIGEGALTAYVLDPDKALSVIQKQAKAAQFVGFAREAGFGLSSITAEAASNIAGTAAYATLNEQQLQRSLQQAGQLRREQSRLAGIEGEPYQEQEALDAVISGSSDALLASQRRAEREVSRFRGTSGLTGSSLRSSTLI
jgi:hypothetical protein